MEENQLKTIRKRNGVLAPYNRSKIEQAVAKAYKAKKKEVLPAKLETIAADVEKQLQEGQDVEDIQDLVEAELMKQGDYEVAKAYILYRQKRTDQRSLADYLAAKVGLPDLKPVLLQIQRDFDQNVYELSALDLKFTSFQKEGMDSSTALKTLEKAAVELTSQNAPKWEEIAGRILNFRLEREVASAMKRLELGSWHQKLSYLARENLLLPELIQVYSQQDIEELSNYMDPSRTRLLKHSGLDLLYRRYLITNGKREVLETVPEMFMGIAMHLALPEQNKVYWAKRFYDMLSTLQVTMATPTMANARKPFHQMSSCFIDTVNDSLSGIYKSVDNFAQVSKHGGGMGLYFGKVRANGSEIRGFEGAAGGVIRWVKLINDTAVAVDQLGVRQGAAAVYLDVWHKDIPEFLQLKTNNGDDRMKAHDIFPAVCFPDLFWKLAKQDLDADWIMMCPHEIYKHKGYHLEDYYGKEWEKRYQECIADPLISRRVMPVREVVRLIIKSQAETGTPFVFNRDAVNEANPNKHTGMIYSSNLCTEIAQNMSAMSIKEPQIIEVDGETVVSQITKPGDFVTCNLASLSLGHIDVDDDEKLEHVVTSAMRALDNVIDLNYYPLAYARLTCEKYRPVGLGTSGYQHLLAKKHIPFESEKHLQFMDDLYERINYFALKASNENAREKGSYFCFKGSDFQTGAYFQNRGYTSPKWTQLAADVMESGLRNGYLMAIAPTSSTSIIAGTTAAVDPVINRFYLEEKKGSMIPRVVPDLSMDTFWYYKNAHYIDQNWVVDAAAIRQKHIDQSQSVNLYITNEYTFRKILELYIRAWGKGVKTLYYVRSKSLEVEECESCSA